MHLWRNLAPIHRHQCCLPATLVLAPVVNSSVMLVMIGHNQPNGLAPVCNVNGGLPAQPALSLLLQGSTRWLHSELTYVFGTWRISSSRSSIWCAMRQRRI